MRQPILIDTSMAADDWMAIAYLLHCPDVDVRAITVAATGEAHAKVGVDNVLRLLTLINAPMLPVASGRTTPLQGNHTFPAFVRILMNRRMGLRLPRAIHRPSPLSAVEVLRQHLIHATQPMVLIALGPLTNIADLLRSDPRVAEKIVMIYIMGGAIDAPGNLSELNQRVINPYAEWNIYIDAHAANIVFQSGVPLTLVPLDVTQQVPLTDAFFTRWAAMQRTAAAQFIYQVMQRLRTLSLGRPIYLLDPLASVIATYPKIAQFERRRLRVVEKAGSEYGRTRAEADGSEIRVCTKVDQTAFESFFINTVNQDHNQALSKAMKRIPQADPELKRLAITGEVILAANLETLIKESLLEADLIAPEWGSRLLVKDRHYFAIHPNCTDAIIHNVNIERFYVRERFDCDDFSRVFFAKATEMVDYEAEAGLAIAYCSFTYWHESSKQRRAHALNLIVRTVSDSAPEAILFEPQTKELFLFEAFKEKYVQAQITTLFF